MVTQVKKKEWKDKLLSQAPNLGPVNDATWFENLRSCTRAKMTAEESPHLLKPRGKQSESVAELQKEKENC